MNKPIPPVLAIVGSRNWPDREQLKSYVQELPSGTVVVSGGWGTVDLTVAQVAAYMTDSLTFIEFSPRKDWDKWRIQKTNWPPMSFTGRVINTGMLPKVYPHFAAAAHARNSMIVNYCVEHGGGLTAFLDETVKSNGTRSTIEKAEKAGVLYEVITYKGAKA